MKGDGHASNLLRYRIFARIFLIALGVGAIVWATLVFPVVSDDAPLDRIAGRIIEGELYKRDVLDRRESRKEECRAGASPGAQARGRRSRARTPKRVATHRAAGDVLGQQGVGPGGVLSGQPAQHVAGEQLLDVVVLLRHLVLSSESSPQLAHGGERPRLHGADRDAELLGDHRLGPASEVCEIQHLSYCLLGKGPEGFHDLRAAAAERGLLDDPLCNIFVMNGLEVRCALGPFAQALLPTHGIHGPVVHEGEEKGPQGPRAGS